MQTFATDLSVILIKTQKQVPLVLQHLPTKFKITIGLIIIQSKTVESKDTEFFHTLYNVMYFFLSTPINKIEVTRSLYNPLLNKLILYE